VTSVKQKRKSGRVKAARADDQHSRVTHCKSGDEWRVTSDEQKTKSGREKAARADDQLLRVTYSPVSVIGSVR